MLFFHTHNWTSCCLVISLLAVCHYIMMMDKEILPLLQTWDLGGGLSDGWRTVAFSRAGSQGERVRWARIETQEHVTRLISQFDHLATLVGEVQHRVEWTHCFIWDLRIHRENVHELQVYAIFEGTSFLHLLWINILSFCIDLNGFSESDEITLLTRKPQHTERKKDYKTPSTMSVD